MGYSDWTPSESERVEHNLHFVVSFEDISRIAFFASTVEMAIMLSPEGA